MKLSAARGRLKFSDNTTGAALMSGAALAFVLNDFLMKLVFAELSVVQGVFVRGMMVSPLLVAVCFYHKQLFVRLPARDRGLVFWRTALEIAITFLFLQFFFAGIVKIVAGTCDGGVAGGPLDPDCDCRAGA